MTKWAVTSVFAFQLIAMPLAAFAQQGRGQLNPSDEIASRYFVEWALDQAGRKTTSIPMIHSELSADLRLGIAFRSENEQLLESRIDAFTTGMRIATLVVKNDGAVLAWLRARANDIDGARVLAQNETLVNRGYTAESAAGAVTASRRIRAKIGNELSALERDFRLAVVASLSKESSVGALLQARPESAELLESRVSVRRLLTASGAAR